MNTIILIARLFYIGLAVFYLSIFLYLASLQDTGFNVFCGLFGGCFGLLMERLINYYATYRNGKPTA